MPELLLALDAGTTTMRACLFSPGGALLGRAAQRLTTRSPAPGLAEQDPAAVWRAARKAMAGALGARTWADVAAIGVTSQRTSAMLWDRKGGKPLTPLVLWSDLRGAGRAAVLRDLGMPVSPQQAVTKLEALVASVPDAASLVAQKRLAFGNIDAFLTFKLTGIHATDRSQAWPTGYLDLATFGWNPAVMGLQNLDPSIFPMLVDTWGEIGRTREGAPVAAIVADQQSAMLGHGAEAAGESKVTYGTSATLNVSTGGDFVWKGGTIPPFVLSSVGSETRFCLEGMVNSAGAGLDWLRKTFRLGDHARMETLAQAHPDAGGVAVLPAFQGLGAPHGDLTRRAAVTGLSLASGPGQIARAGLEGLAFRVREVFEHVYTETGLAAPDALPVDGGLTGSDALMQVQADLLGRPVQRHALRDATAAGAALAAARGIGLKTSGFARYDRFFEPAVSRDEADARFSAWKEAVHV
ncbi:MAG: FGGY-family carbohydrate kinase [Caulobacteraceae bacterium]